MNNMKLSKRLLKIAEIVSGDVICDVGCDHGKLSYYLLKNNIVKFAYVSDISMPSLQKAEKLLGEENLQFESLHCDGLLGFAEKKVDECIIAGMGGDEIIKIIENSPINISSYILSPQHNILEVKNYMLSKGYYPVFDKIIKDGHKFYNIFKFVANKKVDYPIENLYFGKDYLDEEKEDLSDYLNVELGKANLLLNKVDSSKKEKLTNFIMLIEKAKKDWNL